jgi:hypothetical protein
MNSRTLIAVFAATFASALAAVAQASPVEPTQSAAPIVTRAQVLAEFDAARARGEVATGDLSYVAPATGRALTRAEVLADLARARANGELAHGEMLDVPMPVSAPRTRAEVKAEWAAARARGETNIGDVAYGPQLRARSADASITSAVR